MLDKYYHGTAEQLNEVLTNGSATFTDKDGNQQTITREQIENGTVVIDTGSADIATFLNAVRADMHRLYGYNHSAIVTDDLETIYNAIVSENPELADVSAYGFLALLKNGDEIPIPLDGEGELFINGTKADSDYTFTGEGVEFCRVWCFGYPIYEYRQKPLISEIIIKAQGEYYSDIDADFVNYTPKIVENNDILADGDEYGIREIVNKKGGVFSDNPPSDVAVYTNYCTQFLPPPTTTPFRNRTKLIEVHFPELLEIPETGYFSFLNGCTNCEKITFPKLKTVGSSNGSFNDGAFYKVPFVVLPPTVEYVGRWNFNQNRRIELQCEKDAVFHTQWCVNAPNEKLVISAPIWKSKINLTTAAAGWNFDDYKRFFDKLYDYSDGEAHIIYTPQNIVDAVNSQQKDPTEVGSQTWAEWLSTINWTVETLPLTLTTEG